jgi:hypothetical protein
MDQKLVGRYFTTQSLLHAVFLAVESYGLSYIIWALLPKFWAFSSLLEFFVSVIVAYFIADFIFNRWNTTIKNRLLAAIVTAVATYAVFQLLLVMLRFVA